MAKGNGVGELTVVESSVGIVGRGNGVGKSSVGEF